MQRGGVCSARPAPARLAALPSDCSHHRQRLGSCCSSTYTPGAMSKRPQREGPALSQEQGAGILVANKRTRQVR